MRVCGEDVRGMKCLRVVGKEVGALFYLTTPHSCPPRLLAQRQQHSFGLHGVACVGTEAHLSLCSLEFYRANDTTRCPGGAPAVVSCVPGPLYTVSSGQKKQQQSKPQGEVCEIINVFVLVLWCWGLYPGLHIC